MKIALLSRQAQSVSSQRLKDAARERGHALTIYDTLKFSIGVERQNPALLYKNKPIPHFDAVIPRIGASITFFGLAVLRQFEQMGIYAANESQAVSRSRDKLRSIQILSRHDIGIPESAFVRDKNDILPAIRRLGGAPVIIKVLEGTQGVGVILAESDKTAEAIIETLQGARQNVLIQKFVKESKGRDIRAIVVGDYVVAAMRRVAIGDEYRSNVHRGGMTEKIALSREQEHTAIRAAQIMGLQIAGVDMLETASGPQVMEVNSSPGLEGIEEATGVDVAGAMIKHIEQQVLFPDVDLRQRLRLAAGYGIAEFTVHNLPALEGKRLRDTDLAARDILIIQIHRGNHVIPYPKGDDDIKPGDTLLCYGDLHELRLLMPPHQPRNNRPRPVKLLEGAVTASGG